MLMRVHPASGILILLSGFIASCSYRFYPSGCEEPLPGNLIPQCIMEPELAETSGLFYLDGLVWTFNDSGGEAALYAMDQDNARVIRKTIISNAFNVDWEDVAMDGHHIYVADVGNNFAARDTLIIYRIPKSGLLSGDPSINHDGIISLTFEDEITRSKTGYSSHDCEAVFAFGDSLYLFTKNWVDETTSVYVIPVKPGHYQVKHRFLYETRMLVTGADILPEKKMVVLVGYRNLFPVVIRYGYDDDPGRIDCGGKARFYPFRGGSQVEGVCFNPAGELYISSEKRIHMQKLYKVGMPLH